MTNRFRRVRWRKKSLQSKRSRCRSAVYHVPRELEYGLTFYRNHLTFNYDWGKVPKEEHLVVAPENSQVEIAKLVAGRRVSYLGHYAPRHVDYFWVAAASRILALAALLPPCIRPFASHP